MINQMQIYLFPYAGGNACSYRPLLSMLNNCFEVVTPELPGRGVLAGYPPICDIHELVNHLFDTEIRHRDTVRPYLLFGHSMGAIIVYLLAHRIRRSGLRMPSHIVLTGCNAPGAGKNRAVSHLSSDALWEWLSELGGVPAELQKHTAIQAYLEPIIRNDFYLLEHYRYQVPQKPLNLPMTVIHGSREHINRDLWQIENLTPVNFIEMEGNHFFILNHWPALARYLRSLVGE